YIGLKVLQGTGSIFDNFTQKSPPSELKSRFVNPHLKAIAFLFNSVLAKLFSARVLFSPSRQTKSKAMVLDLDKQVYEPNRLDHSFQNSPYSKNRYVISGVSPPHDEPAL
ncbi:hypothetical protein, partial [Bacillus toyonensis]|uniref:hypothetical protein n=1 Tax=Bacillus toyonensis TaxID=155322 RepID=UPI001C54E386